MLICLPAQGGALPALAIARPPVSTRLLRPRRIARQPEVRPVAVSASAAPVGRRSVGRLEEPRVPRTSLLGPDR